jgi:hypothetical protein
VKPVVLALVALALLPASAAALSPADVGKRLKREPVYVGRGSNPTLSVAQRGRVRLRIVRRDRGRIKVAVLSLRAADRAGGTRNLANQIDQATALKGNLIVVAGPTIHLVTSYRQVEPALNALREAVESHQGEPLVNKLLAGVDGVGSADPGPGLDLGAGSPPPQNVRLPDVKGATDDVVGTVKLVLFIIGGAIALPFLLVGGWLALRLRRRRADEAEVLAEQRDQLDSELGTLGDSIRDLDLDVDMPDADPEGKAEYEQAVALYDQANQILTTGPRRGPALARVKQLLDEGSARMSSARQRLDAQRAATQPPGPA